MSFFVFLKRWYLNHGMPFLFFTYFRETSKEEAKLSVIEATGSKQEEPWPEADDAPFPDIAEFFIYFLTKKIQFYEKQSDSVCASAFQT